MQQFFKPRVISSKIYNLFNEVLGKLQNFWNLKFKKWNQMHHSVAIHP